MHLHLRRVLRVCGSQNYSKWKNSVCGLISLRSMSCTSNLKTAENTNNDEMYDDIAIDEMIGKNKLKLGIHNVFVLQPDIIGDSRPSTMSNTTGKLQLEESLALVDCLPGWKISGSLILSTRTPNENRIFKGERLKKLVQSVAEYPETTAIFFSLNRLHGLQRKFIMEQTKVENILDRYMLVLEIFRLRAQTKQAKLQVALAEIPYLRMNLRSELTTYNRQGGGFNAVGGPGETPFDLVMRRFRTREQKIKQRLSSLRKKRDEQRVARKKTNLPVVAVVGYTNAGKTTLIKALSQSERLEPKNHLFATLDVTAHPARSSGNMKYLLIDTVGFLSDLPHTLIDAFTATMEDMLQADIIIHVRDVSHPDHENQRQNVYKILSDLNLPSKLLENMIEVRNKIDLVEDENSVDEEQEQISLPKSNKKGKRNQSQEITIQPSATCAVCATDGFGLKHLNKILHQRLITSTESKNLLIRVPANGDHLDWFNLYATVVDFETDGDFHFVVNVTITEPMLNKFKSRYYDYLIQ